MLFFGANDTMFSTTVRRMAVTKPLNLVPGRLCIVGLEVLF